MIVEQARDQLIPVGEYAAYITNIELEYGDLGPQMCFTFTISEGDHAGTQLTSCVSAHFSPTSRLYAWAKAALNSSIPTEYDLDTDHLMNRTVSLTVVIRTKDDGTELNNIEIIRPYREKLLSGGRLRPTPPPKPFTDDFPF